MKPRHGELPEWVKGCGPNADVVISSRARLARNLRGVPFPWRASQHDLDLVVQKVRSACRSLTDRFPGLKAYAIDKLSPAQKGFLVDARLASAEQISGKPWQFLLCEPSGIFSIMVNEEDHLRLQVIRSGTSIGEVWELANWADDVLAEQLEFAFSSRFGYLTTHVSNVGTGLRVSALMHLAGLAATGDLARHLRAASELAVSIRGAFGEASKPWGDLYQVSNEVTLGIPESEIVERVKSVTEYLLGQERQARNKLLETQHSRLCKEARSALTRLSSAMSLGTRESLTLISKIRLGCSVGVLPECPVSLANELLLAVQAVAGDDGIAKIDRAAVMRSSLRSLKTLHD